MDGMSTQDLLNGQDLSTANVDDLLAAMKQEEGPAPAAPVEEPKPKRGRKKTAEPEPIADLPNLDEMIAKEAAADAAALAAAEAPVDPDAMLAAMASAESAADVDAAMAAMAAGASPMPEMPVEMPTAEAAPMPEMLLRFPVPGSCQKY